MPNLNYSIIGKAGKNYEVTNHETGKITIVSIGTIQARTNCFSLLKEIGFTKEERQKIYGEITTAEQPPQKQEENPLLPPGSMNLFLDYNVLAGLFYKQQPFFYDNAKIWWLWSNQKKFWQRIDETDLLNAIDQNIPQLFLFKQKTKAEIVNALKMVGRNKQPQEPLPTQVQCGTKVIDLNGSLVTESTPEYFFTNPIPHELDSENLECPTIDQLFEDWVAPEYVPLLYEVCAYCMLPAYPLHRTFCLIGDGRNGKSSYTKIITRLIGKQNVCSTNFYSLLNRQFETSKLYKKLACFIGEISETQLKNTDTFKKLTGEDLIRIEFKGKDCFDAPNYAKLILFTNKLPESPDKSKGFFSRWCIIDFANSFPEKPGLIENIPDSEFQALAAKSLITLKRVLKEAKFTKEGTIEERTQRYEERASPINDFLKG